MDLEAAYAFVRSLWVVWLIVLFAGIVWWAYRPKNRRRFEDAANVPFREEDGDK
jgi:cytochrome c oxidase cbb3-type subunit 4